MACYIFPDHDAPPPQPHLAALHLATRLTAAPVRAAGGWLAAIREGEITALSSNLHHLAALESAMDYLPFSAAHDAPVAALLDLCFGPARHLRTASLLRQRAERLAVASFVALDDEQLVGAVQCFALEWRRPDGLVRDLVLLGPLVTHPSRRGQGIGQALMQRATGQLDAAGHSAMLIGDAPYYGQFGFSAVGTAHWRLPGPVDRARLLLRSSAPALFDAEAEIGAPFGCATRAA